MIATPVEIADLIVADFNDAATQALCAGDYVVEAQRSYLPDTKLEATAKALFVFVIPRSMATSNGSRRSTVKQPQIEIGVLCHPPASGFTDQWVDGLAA